jgi:hypothetical protein
MNEYEPLELELAALRPRDPSIELKRRIADDLMVTNDERVNERRTWRSALLVGGLLAASLAAVAAWRGNERINVPEPEPTFDTSIAAAFDTSLPSLWSYRRAWSQPAVPLERLLDQHSRTFRPKAASAFVFARSSFRNNNLTGEL